MKKNKKSIIFVLAFFSLTTFFLNSCRNFTELDPDTFFQTEFYEIDNLSDSIWINGSLAAPILDTKFTLATLLPKLDSSLWVEVDDDDLIHLRSYFKNIVTVTGSQVYTNMPSPSGTVISAATYQLQSDTSKLKIYSGALSGHLFFNNPKFTFKFTNEIPILSFFKLDTITFHELAGTSDSVTHTSNTNYEILAPTVAGTNAKSNIIIDKTVIPQFPVIFSPIPKYVSFCVTVGSEQDQTIPYDLTGDEKISMDVDIDLPLDAKLVDFAMGDTIPFDFTGGAYKQAKSVELRLELDNGFPFQLLTQLTFTDSLNVFEEYMFPQPGWNLASGSINPSGIVTSSTKSRVVITINQELLTRLRDNNVKYLVVKSIANMVGPTDEFVKIFSYYTIGVKIGVKLDFGGSTTDI